MSAHIKKWQERMDEYGPIRARDAEIAELRAALAAPSLIPAQSDTYTVSKKLMETVWTALTQYSYESTYDKPRIAGMFAKVTLGAEPTARELTEWARFTLKEIRKEIPLPDAAPVPQQAAGDAPNMDVPTVLEAFLTWAEQNLAQEYSLVQLEGVYIDKVTRWCFNGFKAGVAYRFPPSPSNGDPQS